MDWDAFKRFVGGTIFTVVFVKRTTGEVRRMNARFGYMPRYLAGGVLPYDPVRKGLRIVFDVSGNPTEPDSLPGYRAIPLDGIVSVRARQRDLVWDRKRQLFR